MKKRSRNISVRIDQESYEKLQQIAKREYRTLSGQVFFWICQCIRKQERANAATPPER